MKRWLVCILALTLLATSVCAAAGAESFPCYPETVTVSIGRSGSLSRFNFGNDDTLDNNAYTRWIKETYNLAVTYEWVVDADYTQKLNLAIIGEELPDIIMGTDLAQLKQMIDGDMLLDLTDAFDRYASPLLHDMLDSYGGIETAWRSGYADGRLYAMGDLARYSQYGVTWIRKDWMEKVGAQPPKTLEELTALAQAFVTADLAGNGQTVGIEIVGNGAALAGNYNGCGSLDPLFQFFGAYPRQWIPDENGQYVYGSVQPEIKDALRQLAAWYNLGVIDREFATKDHIASVSAGNSGILFGPWWLSNWPLNNCRANDPSSEWFPYECLLNADGSYNSYAPKNMNKWLAVSKDCKHPEAAVLLFNLLADNAVLHAKARIGGETPYNESLIPDAVADAYAGVQGIDYGAWPINPELSYADQIIRNARLCVKDYAAFVAGDSSMIPANDLPTYRSIKNFEDGIDTSVEAWNNYIFLQGKALMVDMADKINLVSNYYPPVTDTMELKWSNLDDMETTTFIKIIMGRASPDSFDTFVSDRKAQGGDDSDAIRLQASPASFSVCERRSIECCKQGVAFVNCSFVFLLHQRFEQEVICRIFEEMPALTRRL